MKKKHTKLWEWQERQKLGEEKCAKCGTSENITVDHIIPVSILEPLYADMPVDRYDLIYNDESNFQYLCVYCNRTKKGNLDIRNPKTIPLLEKMIRQIKKSPETLSTPPALQPDSKRV